VNWRREAYRREDRRGREAWRQAVLLLLASVVLAAGVWAARPDRLPLAADPAVYELELAAPLMDTGEARERFDEGLYLFIDTRPDAREPMVTVPGAFVIRSASFDDDLLAVFDFLLPEDQLILFGDGDLAGTNNVAVKLQGRGYANLSLLQGGLRAWREAGGPVSPRTTEGSGS
jgi:rhodanese-related sulfurtransferase